MTIIVDGSKAQVHVLSLRGIGSNGTLLQGQAVLYENGFPKLGKSTTNSNVGRTPAEVFENRYIDKSALFTDMVARDLFIFEAARGPNVDYDNEVRALIHELHSKGLIPFDAHFPGYQPKDSTNSEALLHYDRAEHLPILLSVIKQYLGLERSFDTKLSITWRFEQWEDVCKLCDMLLMHKLCLYAGHTGRGKTKIAVGVTVKLLPTGGLVLVTTPIGNTKKSFEKDITGFHFGDNRNLVVTYMDSQEFKKHPLSALLERVRNGELIFIVLTVQDLRYGENDDLELRVKYQALSDHLDLWIRDERHKEYEGDKTAARFDGIKAKHVLDLTATPYNVLDQYRTEQILVRNLLWGLKHRQHTGLPTLAIESFNSLLKNLDPGLAALFSEEEGFDCRKMVVRDNGSFLLASAWVKLAEMMYGSVLSKRKNQLSIVNDPGLSTICKRLGMWVLPNGVNGDGAGEYIPALVELLNGSQTKVYFVDSYTIEESWRKTHRHLDLGDYMKIVMQEAGKPVVILTCGKFLTGTDIEDLGHVVLMDKISSLAELEQLLGRPLRVMPGKDNVKVYVFAPGMEIAVILARCARQMNAIDKASTPKEYLDCVPITEYDHTGSASVIDVKDILVRTQEILQDQVRSTVSAQALRHALSCLDLSKFAGLKTLKSNGSAKVISFTEVNGAKITTNNRTPKGEKKTKAQQEKVAQRILDTIREVMAETDWLSYAKQDYDIVSILHDQWLVEFFTQEVMDTVYTALKELQVHEVLQRFLTAKQLVFAELDIMDVIPHLFKNTENKKKKGLVYVPVDFVRSTLVSDLRRHVHAIMATGETPMILVTNALSGSIPLVLREQFPELRIVCVECFQLFIPHLQNQGFEVYLHKPEDLDMKNVIEVANYPYQNPKKKDVNGEFKRGKGGNNTLYVNFVEKAVEQKRDRLVTVYPPSGLTKTTVRGKPTPLLELMLEHGGFEYINFDTNKYFSVNTAICHQSWVAGLRTTHTKIISDGKEYMLPNEELFYLPPTFNPIAHRLFQQVCNNRKGQQITVYRNDNKDTAKGDKANDFWFARMGHPYLSKGMKDPKHTLSTSSSWVMTTLGKWYIWYIKQHDAMIYHNMINGLYDGELELDSELQEYLDQWKSSKHFDNSELKM